MLLSSDLRRIVIKQQEDLKSDLGITRDVAINPIPKFASIISGIRRCGKSTLARQVLKSSDRIYYTNFEDINLASFTLDDFIKLDKIFKAEIGDNGTYFFDEIQNINGWEIFIRQLTDKGAQVLITGSNARMLSRELGTKLTGRQITTEIYPFSYPEFLTLRNKKHSINLFLDYLGKGGFPEYLKTGQKEILRNLFQDILYRDIIHRNELRNETAVKTLLQYLLANIGKQISFNRLKELTGVGSGNTISQFIEYFEQAYLLFSIKKYDYSYKKQLINPKKIYCVDNGIIDQNAFGFSENKGRMLENMVFIELKRRALEIYYHKDKYECDFVINRGNKIIMAIQVCYQLDTDNQDRETNGLLDALRSYNLSEGTILTLDQEDMVNIEGKTILIMPVWKWLES